MDHSVAADPQLIPPPQNTPLQKLPNGFERQTVEGFPLLANPDTQVVKSTDAQGQPVLLVPTYRTAVVPHAGVPTQQMTAVEIHTGDDPDHPVGVDSVTKKPVQVVRDPDSGTYQFSQFDQQFEVKPDTLGLTVNGQPIHLTGDPAPAPDPDEGIDTSVMQPLEQGTTVVDRRLLPGGNLQHVLADQHTLTYNPSLRILRRDSPDGTVEILVPAAAVGQGGEGYLLQFKPQHNDLAVVDLSTRQQVQGHVVDPDPQDARQVRFAFDAPDGRHVSLDPYQLTMSVAAPPPAAPQRVALPPAPAWSSLVPPASYPMTPPTVGLPYYAAY